MSSYGITVTILATGLADAVRKDEELVGVNGFNLGAGIYGRNVTEWVREVAKELDDRAQPKQALEFARCSLCAGEESPGFYTGCMCQDLGPQNGWTCDGNGNLQRPKSLDAQIESIARKHGTGGWQTLESMIGFGKAVAKAIEEDRTIVFT